LTAPGSDTSERELIEAAQTDPGRFAELYENNFDRVYAFILRRVSDRAQAEDLTSDVFHQAFANLATFEWRGAPFAAWLFRIARNAIIDRARRAAKEAELPPVLDVPTEAGLEEIEERARLFKLVDGLPTDQRRVIVMRFAEEKSIREIAQEIRRTEGAVKQLQFRALQNLRSRLGDMNG
jgi:RNA polymerase sigma-70 factor (ECF subfamily)